MHIPTVVSVKDVDEHLAAPRLFDRAGADIRDLSRAETLRSAQAGRSPARTAPLSDYDDDDGPSSLTIAFGGIALAVLLIATWHVIAFALDLPDIRDFLAPTSLESQGRSLEQLIEGAAP